MKSKILKYIFYFSSPDEKMGAYIQSFNKHSFADAIEQGKEEGMNLTKIMVKWKNGEMVIAMTVTEQKRREEWMRKFLDEE